MATVNKNFRIKNGLVVEGSTATVNGEDILTKSAADQSYIVDLIGGQATSANTANTVVKRDLNGDFAAGVITADLIGDVTGQVSDISNHNTDSLSEGVNNLYFTAQRVTEALQTAATTDDLGEGANNLYFTNQRALDATANAYDAAGSASTAESNANTYTDNKVSGIDGSYLDWNGQQLDVNLNDISQGLSQTFDSYGSASAAEAAANTYTDTSINALTTDDIEEGLNNKYYSDSLARGAVNAQAGGGLTYDSNTGLFAVDTNSIATQSYVDTAVSNLVDGAPALLDTLNELAAAINDDASFASTITTSLGEKVAKSGDTMTGALVLHADPVNALEAATKQYVDAAESAAQSAAEATAQTALDGVLDGTTDFTALDVNSVSRQVAATTGNISPQAATTALSWAKASYRSAKIVIKAKNGSHTHVSELIVTLDTSDNIALNEYGITTTNGSLMTIDADISGTDVRIRVTPAHDNTEVMAHATLLV